MRDYTTMFIATKIVKELAANHGIGNASRPFSYEQPKRIV